MIVEVAESAISDRGEPMTPAQMPTVRELMNSLGVAQAANDFGCPGCESRSFAVLHARPMEVECLRCGTVAPFSAVPRG